MLQRQHPEYAWCRIYAEHNETVAGWKANEKLPINGAGPWLSVMRFRTKEREYPNRASSGIDTADGTHTNFCMGLSQPTPPDPDPEPTPEPSPTPPPTPLPLPTPAPTSPTPAPTNPPTFEPTNPPTNPPTLEPTELTPAPTNPADPTPAPTNTADPTPAPTPCPSCPDCPTTQTTTTGLPPSPPPCNKRWTTESDYLLSGVESKSTMKSGTKNGRVKYPNVNVKVNGVKTTLDLLMIPLTTWRGKKCNSNDQCTAGGYDAIGGMGMINLEVGNKDSNYEFEYKFVLPGANKDSDAVVVDDVYIEFFDIDTGNNGEPGNVKVKEMIMVKSDEVAEVPINGDQVDFVDERDKGYFGLVAREFGDSKNNPSSLTHMTEVQNDLRAMVRYKNVGKFWVKFGVGSKGNKGGRNFYFSLTDNWPKC